MEEGKDPVMLLTIECDVDVMTITVPEICRSGSFAGFDWERSFFDSNLEATSGTSPCFGIGKEGTDRRYTIPLTRDANDPGSCNMQYKANDETHEYRVFLNMIIQDCVTN